ncbi:hypothetical protein KY285_010584 [Solanum tuberosum]|nr:hypothetical protein KY289_011128 [Solanum tuberosum]KAH0734877.1 hypothetical protein KY285_010584 [Solanum tuberosum]
MRDYPTQRQSGMAHPTGSVVGSSSPVSPIEKGSQSCSGQGRGRGGAVISSGSPNRIFAVSSSVAKKLGREYKCLWFRDFSLTCAFYFTFKDK